MAENRDTCTMIYMELTRASADSNREGDQVIGSGPVVEQVKSLSFFRYP